MAGRPAPSSQKKWVNPQKSGPGDRAKTAGRRAAQAQRYAARNPAPPPAPPQRSPLDQVGDFFSQHFPESNIKGGPFPGGRNAIQNALSKVKR